MQTLLLEGVVDSSGVELTYLDFPREHNAGSFAVGHKVTPHQLVPPKLPNFDVHGICNPSCNSQVST